MNHLTTVHPFHNREPILVLSLYRPPSQSSRRLEIKRPPRKCCCLHCSPQPSNWMEFGRLHLASLSLSLYAMNVFIFCSIISVSKLTNRPHPPSVTGSERAGGRPYRWSIAQQCLLGESNWCPQIATRTSYFDCSPVHEKPMFSTRYGIACRSVGWRSSGWGRNCHFPISWSPIRSCCCHTTRQRMPRTL